MSGRLRIPLLLAAALVSGACGATDDAGPPAPAATATVESPAEPTTAAPSGDADAESGGAPDEVRFAMWPVVAVDPDPCSGTSIGEFCRAEAGLVLGAEVIESAEARLEPVAATDWLVSLELSGAGIDRFNALAAMCFERTGDCPTGRLAVQVDDDVVSAPQVNAPSFERDQIVISGGFGEAEARSLAEALTAGG